MPQQGAGHIAAPANTGGDAIPPVNSGSRRGAPALGNMNRLPGSEYGGEVRNQRRP